MSTQTGTPLWEKAVMAVKQIEQRAEAVRQQRILEEQRRRQRNREKAILATKELEAFLQSDEWKTASQLLALGKNEDGSIKIVWGYFPFKTLGKTQQHSGGYIPLHQNGLNQSPEKVIDAILDCDEYQQDNPDAVRDHLEMIVTADNLEQLVPTIRARLDAIALRVLQNQEEVQT